MRLKTLLPIIAFLLASLCFTGSSKAQSTVFTYQGNLGISGNPANGNYDLIFLLSTNANGTGQIGGTVTNLDVGVRNGLFTAALDFGAGIFTGENCWLEVGVRTNGSNAGFTLLSPLQPVTATPYAITAANFSGTLSPGQLTGTYSSALTLNNPGNQVVGTFTGNGAGLTNLSPVGLTPIGAFGAQGGTHDDTAAFQAALNSGAPVYVDGATNYSVGNLWLTNNSCLIGYNAHLIFLTSYSGAMFTGISGITNVVLEGLYLDGQSYGFTSYGEPFYSSGSWVYPTDPSPGITAPERYGLHLGSNSTNAIIAFDSAIGFSGIGFIFDGYGETFPQPTWQTVQFVNCNATTCWIGSAFTNDAEYMNIQNFKSADCGEGLEVDSGNDFVNGGQHTRDGVGIFVQGGVGLNPAHSSLANLTINHCEIAAAFNDFNNGEYMQNCNVEGDGAILITNCAGVVIKNCTLTTQGSWQQSFGYDVVADGGAGNNAGMNYFLENGTIGNLPIIGALNGGLVTTNGSFQTDGSPLPYFNGWNNIFTGSNTFAKISGNGSGLTNLPPSAVAGGATTNVVIGGVTLVFTNGIFAGAH